MVRYFQNNFQFVLLVLFFLVVGIYLKMVSLLLIPLIFILLIQKKLFEEAFIGFFAILIFSDSFYMTFAKDIKPFLLLIMGFFFVGYTKPFLPLSKLYIPFGLFLIYSFITLFQSETYFLSLQKALSYTLLYMFVPNYVSTIYREKGIAFFKNLMFFIGFILFVGLLFKYLWPDIAISHSGRFRGIFGNPNGVGIFCLLSFILFNIVSELFPGSFDSKEKIFIYTVIVLSAIFSASRTCITGILIYLLFSSTQKRSAILTSILFILILITYQVISENLIYIVRYFNLEDYFRIQTIEEGSGRIFAWKFAWQEIQKNFWFGKGVDYNQFLFFLPETQQKLNLLNHQGGVHNVYLAFWLDYGIVGLSLFLYGFVYVFAQASKITHLAFPAMFAMLFLSNFEPWLTASLNPFTIMFLIIVSVILYCKREDKIEGREFSNPAHV